MRSTCKALTNSEPGDPVGRLAALPTYAENRWASVLNWAAKGPAGPTWQHGIQEVFFWLDCFRIRILWTSSDYHCRSSGSHPRRETAGTVRIGNWPSPGSRMSGSRWIPSPAIAFQRCVHSMEHPCAVGCSAEIGCLNQATPRAGARATKAPVDAECLRAAEAALRGRR